MPSRHENDRWTHQLHSPSLASAQVVGMPASTADPSNIAPRKLWALVTVALVVVAGLAIYSAKLASPTPRFVATNPRTNGTLAIVPSDPTSASIASIEANASTTAFAVLGWPSPSVAVKDLQRDGIVVLGYVPEGWAAIQLVDAYATAGMNGIYVPYQKDPTGPWSVSAVVAVAHNLGGFVMAGQNSSDAPVMPAANVNLEVLTYQEKAWLPAVVRSLQPVASRVAVIVEGVSPEMALYLMGSLHTVGVNYLLTTANSTGTSFAPVPNQEHNFVELYDAHRILPTDWLADFSAMPTISFQADAEGTVYFLLQNSSYDSTTLVWTTNYRILAVNLSFGVPLFETPTVMVEANSTDLTDFVQGIGVEGSAVCLVDVEVHLNSSSTSDASNVTMVTAGFNLSSGFPLWQSDHSFQVVAPIYSNIPVVLTSVEGTVVTAQMMIWENYYVGFWVTTANAITGKLIGQGLLPLYSAPSNATLVSGNSWVLSSIGPYVEDSGEVDLNFTRAVPFTLLIDAQATAVFENGTTSPLALRGPNVYYLSRTNGTTRIESYNLTRQRSNEAIDLGDVMNLTGTIGFAENLYVVTAANGTYLAYDGGGQLAWHVAVPIGPTDSPFAPVNLPGNRLLIGDRIYGFSVEWNSYSEEFWILNATTGQVLEFHNETFVISTAGGLPAQLPPAYAPWGEIGTEFEFWSWTDNSYCFVRETPPTP